ncbi:antitoxin [Candidatus Desantisbacteria bacterium CG_4_8_14_3_um_filter_40_12]|uniref:Antitoxin n=2 Tax=unclassified Candidatus Desantisiibacteriota TaxID=3106372 RepID=A0A2M7JF90_9BACT|nr:MAG: antitoxin [Candidatus Desantisbacteria bacterium CG_4_8_14_3_um_filter_40_12]PIY20384.1 MAG: antitoxin [Candidatus Desantisbacteria bacterium CG_4_10_14_3_um_filter_40_18]
MNINDKRFNLINYRLDKAQDTLESAMLMLDNNYLSGTVNRLYYACFYAVIALLSTQRLSSSKHFGVLAIFNREFVAIGRVDRKWGRFYTNLFDSRQEGDYDDFVSFDKERVNNLYLEACQFVINITEITREEMTKM